MENDYIKCIMIFEVIFLEWNVYETAEWKSLLKKQPSEQKCLAEVSIQEIGEQHGTLPIHLRLW